MDFLLWIALIGVIVFLLGLIYSKLTTAKAKQPAASIIPPATAVTPKSKEPEKKPAPAAPVKTSPSKQERAAQPVIKTPAATETTEATQKIVPDAEPVGPAHSPVVHIASKAAETNPAEAVAAPSPVAETPAPPAPSEPERLRKPRQDKVDDLTQITGIGNAIQAKLYNAGIFHYDQLTDLNADQITWLNRTTGFAGRAERENWVAQAKKLMSKAAATEAPKRAVKKATKPAAVKTKSKPAKKTEKA